MTPEARREIEALAAQHLAQQQPRVVMLTPLDQPDRAWCNTCQLPSRLRAASLFLGPLAFGLRLWLRALGVIRDPADYEPEVV